MGTLKQPSRKEEAGGTKTSFLLRQPIQVLRSLKYFRSYLVVPARTSYSENEATRCNIPRRLCELLVRALCKAVLRRNLIQKFLVLQKALNDELTILGI